MQFAVEFNRSVGLAALANATWLLFVVFLAFATPGRRTIQRFVDRSVSRLAAHSGKIRR